MLPAMTTIDGKVLGPHHFRAKMTYEMVDELRRLRQQFGLTYRALGALFDIDHKTARSIALGKTWAPVSVKMVFRAGADESERIRCLVAEGTGTKKIARMLGVTEPSVRLVMQAYGIKGTNQPPGWMVERKQAKQSVPVGHG